MSNQPRGKKRKTNRFVQEDRLMEEINTVQDGVSALYQNIAKDFGMIYDRLEAVEKQIAHQDAGLFIRELYAHTGVSDETFVTKGSLDARLTAVEKDIYRTPGRGPVGNAPDDYTLGDIAFHNATVLQDVINILIRARLAADGGEKWEAVQNATEAASVQNAQAQNAQAQNAQAQNAETQQPSATDAQGQAWTWTGNRIFLDENGVPLPAASVTVGTWSTTVDNGRAVTVPETTPALPPEKIAEPVYEDDMGTGTSYPLPKREDYDWKLYDVAGQTVFSMYGENGELAFKSVSYIVRVHNGQFEQIEIEPVSRVK